MVSLKSKTLHTTAPFEIIGYTVDPAALRVSNADGEIRLESKSMGVLVYLAERAGEVVSREELEARLWPGRIVTEDAVTNAIGKLRKAFNDNARNPRLIETIPKTGYRLIAPVTPVTLHEVQLDQADTWTATPLLRWPSTVTAVILLLVAGGWYLMEHDSPTRTHPPSRPAVAVLPFNNLSASPEQGYLADGITADLITDLSKLSALSVIAPGLLTSAAVDRDQIHELSEELGVRYLVIGSVQKADKQLRINVQLYETNADRALWGERYDGELKDIFEIQDTLTQAVITALEVKLVPQERVALTKRPTNSVAAYDHYLRALSAHGHRSRQDNQLAKEQFQLALELDPGFARAYSGLAMALSRDAIDGWSADPAQSLTTAKELADKATALDPELSQAHFVMGQIELFRRRHMQAIEAVQRAIELDPKFADAYGLRAWILNYAGRPDEALAAMREALHLNSRPSASYLEVLGEIQFVQRRYADAAETLEQALQINPEYMRARMWYAAALSQAGDLDAAQWEATQLKVQHPEFRLARLALAFPFKDERELDHLIDGLKAAGLKE